jgi:3-carboxy-cis,cis-muconate cycloisomerase
MRTTDISSTSGYRASVKRSSSSSDERPGLLSEILERGSVRGLTDDAAWLGAMVDAEVALARAQAAVGLISHDDATAIARACDGARFDVATIGREAGLSGTPVLALIATIRSLVPKGVADSVHHGATSQDIVDTATMIVARRATEVILADLAAAGAACAGLAKAHRETPIIGRTLLQPAVPTTFGLKAAGWMTAIDAAAAGIEAVRDRDLAVQLGGAVGSLAAFGDQGQALVRAYADQLGLPAPPIPWHTDRTRVAEIATALGVAACAVCKPARDVVLLAQFEVAEVSEGVGGRGGSSAMAHKHNPVAAIATIASARRAPGLVATILASMAHEHERAAGDWQAEWLPLRDLMVTTGSAAAWIRDCVGNLEIDPARMRANLDRALEQTGGAVGPPRFEASMVAAATSLVDTALRQRSANLGQQGE